MALICLIKHAKPVSSSKILSNYFQNRLSLIPRVGGCRYISNDSRKENIVIVGAGIAGLASALSLQRLKFSLICKFAFFKTPFF